jgi:hypothetical protein
MEKSESHTLSGLISHHRQGCLMIHAADQAIAAGKFADAEKLIALAYHNFDAAQHLPSDGRSESDTIP